ncbi:MAG: hypothetical protein PW786_08495 [Arachidicoccus sp.]|nr:hypothetical protein [Arachidicoccus sp.]
MKNLVFILLMLPLFSFSQTTQTNYKHDSIYNFLFNKDSIVIKVTDKDSNVYSKSDLLYIEKNYPELLDNKYTLSPEEVYNQNNCAENDSVFHHFASEVGQDEFYVLYGYFLSIRNGANKYKIERKLFTIYETINSINTKLETRIRNLDI